MRRLIGLSYSPWTEKARWSLDHHGLEYHYREHTILLGSPRLRLQSRRFTGRVTVPALLDEGRVFGDSHEIARRADEVGSGPTLFPSQEVEEIFRWNLLSERALQAG